HAVLTTAPYTLPLHDALPIYVREVVCHQRTHMTGDELGRQKLIGPWSLQSRHQVQSDDRSENDRRGESQPIPRCPRRNSPRPSRSEEHTSELQSHLNLVCRLL